MKKLDTENKSEKSQGYLDVNISEYKEKLAKLSELPFKERLDFLEIREDKLPLLEVYKKLFLLTEKIHRKISRTKIWKDVYSLVWKLDGINETMKIIADDLTTQELINFLNI